MLCSTCAKPIHIRCVSKPERTARSFQCPKCKAPVTARDASSESIVASTKTLSGVNNGAKVCASGPSSARNQSQSGICCEEILLEETQESSFDSRMASLGFKRSPTQPNTIGDGACGIRALCDQLSISTTETMFGKDDHEFARKCIAMQAKLMVRGKVLDEAFFEPNVNEWSLRMSQNSEFIDHIFLQVFCLVLERDIVVIPQYRETAAGALFGGNGDFRWIRGKLSSENLAITFFSRCYV